jgi:Ca2+-transporting ATPase
MYMWQSFNIHEIERKFRTNINQGLTKDEAIKRQSEYGENKLKDRKKENIFIKFLKQFNDYMIIILIIAAIVSAGISFWQGENDYIDSIIIISIVVLNAIMGIVQEAKAEKSLEALKNMSAPVAKVRRDNRIVTIRGSQIVPGDIVLLEAGNFVPADCRLVSSSNLRIEESSLTGETIPSQKDSEVILDENTPIGDITNMAFANTIVVNGHAEAIVTEIGMNTKVGKIANMIINNESPETPIQRKLGEVGKTLGTACLVICALIFVIGVLKKIPPIEMFMTSVGLAVAAIPEGLPAIVTIMLSIGVTKMAKKNSIIRKLPAVETLGSSSVICSDKTGTLTQNKMQVKKIMNINGECLDKEKNLILELGTMCTDVEGDVGEATELAIVNAAKIQGKFKERLYQKFERIADIPFDSERKMMSTIHKTNIEYTDDDELSKICNNRENKYISVTKGAPDVLLKRCTKYYHEGKTFNLDNKVIENIEKNNNLMADNALRVIAVAYSQMPRLPTNIDQEEIENNLTFVGLIGMIDPPREGVKEAVSTCRNAGVKTVMITGDHIATANAIAKEIGILKKGDLSITGRELDHISDKEFEKNINKYSVFARVSPEHKVKIVNAFQKTGAVVAMTGDGVNDAPALKKADIGIAMGKNGTDVAKNASDMILTDDNFITIVEAVKEGRNIFENIKKAVHFLIATNIGEIVTIFMGLLLGMQAPLLAIQLLWINLITDSLPAIAIGLEPADKDIMNKKPRDNKKGIFSDGLWGKILIEGTMLGMLTLLAFMIGNNLYGLEVGRSMAFVSLGLLELVHSFNVKSEESIFSIGLFENKYLIVSFILGVLLQVIVVMVPIFASIFSLVPLNGIQWLYTMGISILPIVIMELQKKINEIKFGKRVYSYNNLTVK